ncbi:MAG: SPFH/Band 7/PHB domain protein [Malacoplasma sp.]|nr:SPFH/Band 7/PHB domain protein [Malacoplasma sp.]
MDIISIIIISVVFAIILLTLLIILFTSIKIVPQADFYIVERLGRYRATWKAGIHVLAPFVDKVVKRESLKEKVIDFPSQRVITKDNVTMAIDTVTYLQILDPQCYYYGVDNAIKAIENLVATTLRNFLGTKTVNDALTSRQDINMELTKTLDEAANAWGIKVNRVELKEISPPPSIQQAMEKLLQAERDKTARITEAEGYRESLIKRAEGESESMIKLANAKKEAQILEAQGKKESVQLLLSSNINDKVLTWISLDKIDTLANGNATKIILPPNLTSLASLMATFDAVKKEEKNNK